MALPVSFRVKQKLALTPPAVKVTKHAWAALAHTSPHCDAILLGQPRKATS